MEVRKAIPAEVRALGHVLGRAFLDDPISEFLFPDPAVRLRKVIAFHTTVLRHVHLPNDETYTTDTLAGAALWDPPGRWKVPPRAQLRVGPRMLALTASNRFRGLRAMAVIEKHHPTEPHWYLGVLGTDPAHQGRGVGSALLGPVLGRCDREGTAAYLESSKESNIGFYERHGFRVTGAIPLPHGGPTVYPMWREPQPA